MKIYRLRIIEVIVMLALLSGMLFPSTISARSTSRLNTIINNLRQISGAQAQWVIEKKHSGPVQVKHEDLAPYLKNGWVEPVADEAYILTTTDRDPLAVLTRKVEGLPIGTVIQLENPAFVLPPGTYRSDPNEIPKEQMALVLFAGVLILGAIGFMVRKAIR